MDPNGRSWTVCPLVRICEEGSGLEGPVFPRGLPPPGPPRPMGSGRLQCCSPTGLRGPRLSWESRVESIGAPLARVRAGWVLRSGLPHPLDSSSPVAQLTRPEHCQGQVDTETAAEAGRERRVRRVRPPDPARPQPPRRRGRRRGPGPHARPGRGDRHRHSRSRRGLRAHGYSWASIGARLSITPPGRPAAMGSRWQTQVRPGVRGDGLLPSARPRHGYSRCPR